MIDVALVGCGHMGAHHARTIAAHPGCRLVAAIDLCEERASAVASATGARVCRDVPRHVDAVVVATPTTTHAAVAGPLVERGVWCLVEKSLAASLGDAERLAAPRLRVGHSERFNPAVRAVGQPRPCGFRSARRAPPTPRALDVDVVLDLMIHDLDLLLWWSGGAVELVAVEGDAEHEVTAVVESPSAGTATLTVSRRAAAPERRILLETRGAPVELDLLAGRAWRGADRLPAPDARDALTAQWEAFVAAVRGRPSEAVTGGEAVAALRLAQGIRAALRDTSAA